MATYAGRYSEDLQDRYGNGYRNALVAVETLAAAPVTLYADRDKTAYIPASGLEANEIKADSRGNLIFFADPGNYQIVVTPVGGSTLAAFPISVRPDPLEPDASEGALQAEEDARIAGDQALEAVKQDATFAITPRTGSFERSVNDRFADLPTVSIKDFGDDSGAIGDGVVRKVSASTVTAKTSTFGFSGSHRLDDFDAEDTEDWLAVTLALKHLQSKGGGTLYVPRPSVSYPIRRFIPVPAGVPLRIIGDGIHDDIYDFDNVCDLPTGWQAAERRAVFQLADFKLQALVNGGAGASTQVAVAATNIGYTAIVPLATGGGATFSVGDRVVVYHTDNYAAGATVCPYRLCFRHVVDISTDDLLLDEPVPFYLPSGKGRVALMGTGTDGTYGNAPFDFVEDVEIRGLSGRGSSFLGQAVAGRGCHFEDFRLLSDRAVTNDNNLGLAMNGFVDTTARRFEIITKNRGIEVKAGSGGQWDHQPDEERGGTGLLLEDFQVRQIGTDAATAPLFAVGESSNCKIGGKATFIRGEAGLATLIKLLEFDVVVMRGLTLEIEGGSDNTGVGIDIVGHPSPVDRSLADVKGIRIGGDPDKLLRTVACSAVDARPKPNLIYGNLRLATTIGGSFETTTFLVPNVGHASMFDLKSEAGETLGFHGTSVVPSPIEDVLGATAAEIADAGSWINTSYLKSGKPLYDTTNGRLLWSTGTAWVPIAKVSELSPTVYRKTADQNIVDASTANVTGLTIPLAANQVKAFEGIIFYDSTTSNDITVGATVPAGATLSMGNAGLATNAVAVSGVFNAAAGFAEANFGGVRAAGAARVKVSLHVRGIVVNGATAGNLQMTARKLANTDATSPADDVLIYANSYLI